MFQIIESFKQPIPWAELTLPEGRTLKAVQVMVDKEKQKVKKARLAAVDGGNELVSKSVSGMSFLVRLARPDETCSLRRPSKKTRRWKPQDCQWRERDDREPEEDQGRAHGYHQPGAHS